MASPLPAKARAGFLVQTGANVDITVSCDAVAVFPDPVEIALPDWSAEHQR
jgi:hypothetical protein